MNVFPFSFLSLEGIYTVPNQQQTGEALSLNSASQDKSKDSRQRSHEEVQRSHEEKYTAFDDLKPQKPSAPSSKETIQ